jgi:hypothetical protein
MTSDRARLGYYLRAVRAVVVVVVAAAAAADLSARRIMRAQRVLCADSSFVGTTAFLPDLSRARSYSILSA